MNEKKVLTEALELWGTKFQLDMLQEECGELISAISRFKRKRANSYVQMLEEIVDVEILIKQIKLACIVSPINKNTFTKLKKNKINRLRERVKKGGKM